MAHLTIWQWILTALGGISITGLVGGIIVICAKGAFSRAINKINVEKVVKQVVKAETDKIKDLTFKFSVQPILESGLMKVTENANAYIDEVVRRFEGKQAQMLEVLEKLSAYFDNSIGVSESAKQALKEAIERAKNEQIIADEQLVEVAIKDENKPQNEPLNDTKEESTSLRAVR